MADAYAHLRSKAVAAAALMTAAHEQSEKLVQDVFYPEHAKRTETSEYKAIHHQMVVVEDQGCLSCGVRNSIVKDPVRASDPKLNPYGAKAVETHHHVIEWALAKAIDLGKFNDRIVRHIRMKPHHDPVYDQDFTQDQMEAWIDHHRDNLWPICDVHHRHKFGGIHAITYPIWGPMDLIRDGYVYTPLDEKTPGPAAS